MCIDRQSCRGISLIEQIVFIVIISVGVVGLISTMSVSVKHSGDPMVRKQSLVIAESLLTEILNQPFTWCDPDDAAADTATQASDCTNSQTVLSGPTPANEVRNGVATKQFDNVADYGGYGQADATDAVGNNPMPGYKTEVEITRAGVAPFGLSAAEDGAVLKVKVTVTPPSGEIITLSSYRFRYAPRY